MDISKEYIKMCEKVIEIQKLWKPQNGDYFYSKVLPEVHILTIRKESDMACGDEVFFNNRYVYYNRTYNSSIEDKKKEQQQIEEWKSEHIFLPRQDQLQEMIGGTSYFLITKMYHKCQRISEHICPYKSSMEQLWLAFVMKEKHNKVWDGEDWKASND